MMEVMKFINEIVEENRCYGCELCANSCPTSAITMEFINGFKQPVVNKQKCINCGKCYKVCIARDNVRTKNSSTLKYYYGYTSDKEALHNSASGGAAFEMYKIILSHFNGIVYGVLYNEESGIPEYTRVDSLDKISKLQGTKYAQATKGSIYKLIKKDLDESRTVLFIGTPCETAAVKRYVGKEYKKLFTVQLICMGVTSPCIFKAFTIEKCNGSIHDVHERYKNDNEWFNSYFCAKGIKNYHRPFDLTEYSFLFKWIGRSSCYECGYKGQNRVADITIGDFWGAKNYVSKINSEGMSIISVHTPKGQILLELMQWTELQNYDEDRFNRHVNNCREINNNRDAILNACLQGMPFKKVVRKYSCGKEKIRYFMSRIVSNKLWNLINRCKNV